MRIHAIMTAAILAAAPAMLEAQITTLLPPPREPEPAEAARLQAEQQEQADSLRRVQLSDMRAWVDSAAAAMAEFRDTVARAVDTTAVPGSDTVGIMRERPGVRRRPEPTVEFREGAPAPATGTGLPTLALVGIGVAGLGVLLLRRSRA